MKAIALRRGGGKTTELLEWAARDVNGRFLLVSNEIERQYVLAQAGRWSPCSPTVWTVMEAISTNRPPMPNNVVVGIDNLDLMLPVLLAGARVGAFSYTPDSASMREVRRQEVPHLINVLMDQS